jgi:hypothetical protein
VISCLALELHCTALFVPAIACLSDAARLCLTLLVDPGWPVRLTKRCHAFPAAASAENPQLGFS